MIIQALENKRNEGRREKVTSSSEFFINIKLTDERIETPFLLTSQDSRNFYIERTKLMHN